jgi:hydroxymethylpyrimidine pyrophosphatase-like HAD family hydrolase
MSNRVHTSRDADRRQRCIAVDFDGVIANYDGWVEGAGLGECRPDVQAALQVLKSEGWKIIVHTTRCAEEIEDYLKANHIPFDEINRNSAYANKGAKPVATVYWDDRSLRYSGDATRDLDMIRGFRTWNGRE